MLLSNTEMIPGFRTVRHIGLVQGNTIRAKNIGRDILAGFKNIVGGELKGYTELLTEARKEATERMIQQAQTAGPLEIASFHSGVGAAVLALGAPVAAALDGVELVGDERARSAVPEMGEADDGADAAARWGAGEGREIIVKLGGAGCLVDGQQVAPPRRIDVVDSSGAGDAFNAGYLHARLAGSSPLEAALAGHRLAGWNIGRRGAIPDKDANAPYDAR